MSEESEDGRRPGPIVFYFDFVSPFAYLGSIVIEQLAGDLGRSVEWRPVLVGVTVLKIMGMKPLPQTPLKGPYLKRDLARLCAFFGVDVPRYHLGSVSSVNACEAFLAISEEDAVAGKRFARRAFEALWREGIDISRSEAVERLAGEEGFSAVGIGSAASRARLRNAVNAAVDAGVFGVPSFLAEGELFFGNDHVWMLEHWLRHGRFSR